MNQVCGGILCDSDLKSLSDQLVTPFDQKSVQPSSYDLSLDNRILIPIRNRRIDIRQDDPKDFMRPHLFDDEYVLRPGESILGSTVETIHCPNHLSARIEGKSSLGRLFMAVHITAGVIDAGWSGQITLEIVNHGLWEIVLWPNMKIAQLSYFTMTGPCEIPYGDPRLGSHYLGQTGPTASAGNRVKLGPGKICEAKKD